MEHQASSPTPEMFLSDTPFERMIGLEVEYSLQAPAFNDVGVFIKNIEEAGFASIGGYLNNGARLYKDNSLIEYCTPECLGPYQAAAADMAGIQVLSAIVTASKQPHQGGYRISGTTLRHEENSKEATVTSGAHENFMIPRSIVFSPLLARLMPTHLASRVWATNGAVTSDGYRFSQKVSGIGDVIQYTTRHTVRTREGEKSMILVPSSENDEDIMHNDDWARMEVRFADPLQSLEGQRTNLGATSLTLRLIEHQRRLKKDAEKDRFADIIVNDPLLAAKLFMSDLSLKQTVEVASGKQQNALAIGEQLATMAIELSTMIDLPVDEVDSAYNWLETIHALRRSNPQEADYDRFLLKRFDMAAKHGYLARTNALKDDIDVARGKSLYWDKVLPAGFGQQYWQKHYGEDEEVQRLKTHPPQTRAAIRGKFIDTYHDSVRIPAPGVNWAMHWEVSRKEDGQYFSDAFGNPIETT